MIVELYQFVVLFFTIILPFGFSKFYTWTRVGFYIINYPTHH